MSETLKTIDASSCTGTGASGDRYYVIFCSRDSEDPTSKPGYAFVVWFAEDQHGHRSLEKAFGFHPSEGHADKAIFGTIHDQMKEEASSRTPSNFLTARLIVRVDKQPFEASQTQIDVWKTSDHNLYAKNCIQFIRSVAVTLGLFPPPIASFPFPPSYLSRFVSTTTQSEIGAGPSALVLSWHGLVPPDSHCSIVVSRDGRISWGSKTGEIGRGSGHLLASEFEELKLLLEGLRSTHLEMPGSCDPVNEFQTLTANGVSYTWSRTSHGIVSPPPIAMQVVEWLILHRTSRPGPSVGLPMIQVQGGSELEAIVTIACRFKPQQSAGAIS